MLKNKKGRPSKFLTIDLIQFKKLVLSGWDDAKIADFFGVTERTLSRWKLAHKDFCLSLKDWKKEADLKVEKSLYQRAIGYQYEEVVYEKSKVGGLGIKLSKNEIKRISHCDTNKTKITVKEVIPDVTAQIFWLKNRQPETWREKHEVEHSGEIGLLTKKEIDARDARLRKAAGIAG